MSMPLPSELITVLQAKIDAACNPTIKPHIPGVVAIVADSHGAEKFAYASGTRGVGSGIPMDVDSIFWIASCTKLITSIACLQLVEEGLIDLDDVSSLEAVLPELMDVQVLEKEGDSGGFRLAPKERGISLRMLLNHTAGFSYSFFNEALRDFSRPVGFDEFSGHMSDMLQPLVHQPGDKWEYGISYDWVGLLVERLSKRSLDEYFKERIFAPLEISEMSFLPNNEMKDRLVYMHQRAPDGELSVRDHLVHRALRVQSPEEVQACFNSGGGGLFAKPGDFCKILSTLLNSGVSPQTGHCILQQKAINELFANQIPQFPNFGRQGLTGAKKDLTLGAEDLYPVEGNPPQGYSMAGMLTPTVTGRAETSVWWSGMPNVFWWCDREMGVAGMVCAQILPFGDGAVMGLWSELEKGVYGGT